MGRAYLTMIILAAVVSAIAGGTFSPPSSSENFSKARAGSASFDEGEDTAAPEEAAEDGTIEIERSYDGHFYADVEINGASVRALVDTGASGIALSREDARSAGLATSISMPEVIGQGADGDVFGERVTLDRVALGHKSAEEMSAIVLNSGEQTLLGQSFLSKFDSVEIRGDTMVLR